MKKLILALMLMAPLATFAQKFGKVNTQNVMASLPEIKVAQGQIEGEQQKLENELKGMQEEFQRAYEAYEKNQSTMNASAKEQKEKELTEMNQKIQQAYQDGQQALQKKYQELMAPVQSKVRQAIDNVGKNGGYTFIFDEGSYVFAGTSVEDVTSKVQTECGKIK